MVETTKAEALSTGSNEVPAVAAQVNTLKPISMAMIDAAIATLEGGLPDMNDQNREVLLQIFDPARTGDIDDDYVQTLVTNYRVIRVKLNADISVRQINNHMCKEKRLFFTNLSDLMVCPYYLEEEDQYRKARTLVHEVTHMALLVSDRPYYRTTSPAYKTLTPRGSWIIQVPLIGPFFREMLKGDTLYHPDAYAHFAMAVSGLPGSEKYHDSGTSQSVLEPLTPATNAEIQVTDSWVRKLGASEINNGEPSE